jgi:hypothetical protein
MQIIGFNLTELHAERGESILAPYNVNTNIDFLELTKQPADLLKDSEALKAEFVFIVSYTKNEEKKKNTSLAEVRIKGNVIIAVSKEEAKELEKNWKKKNLIDTTKIQLFNFILRRSTPKAIQLEEDTGIPLHIPMPRVSPKPEN